MPDDPRVRTRRGPASLGPPARPRPGRRRGRPAGSGTTHPSATARRAAGSGTTHRTRPPAPPPDPAPITPPAWPPPTPLAPPGIPPHGRVPAPPPGRPSRVPLVVGVVGIVAVLVVLGVAAASALRPVTAAGTVSQTGSAPAPVARPRTTPVLAAAPSATAACVSAPSKDGAGVAVTYNPGEVLDGRTDTAWRCDGDGVGQQLRVDLGRRVTVTGIGIVPGYAKTDPADGADRYAQNRRISRVRYTFDDGTSVEQQLDTDPARRDRQTLALTADATTSVTVTVLASVPGQQVGQYPPSDKVAISELQVAAA